MNTIGGTMSVSMSTIKNMIDKMTGCRKNGHDDEIRKLQLELQRAENEQHTDLVKANKIRTVNGLPPMYIHGLMQ